MAPPHPTGRSSTSCGELLDRRENSGLAPAPAGAASEPLLVRAASEPAPVPLRFELRLEEWPVITFRRTGEHTAPSAGLGATDDEPSAGLGDESR